MTSTCDAGSGSHSNTRSHPAATARDGRRRRRVVLRDGAHRQIVRHHEPVVPHLVPQQPGDDSPRQGRRGCFVQRRVADVRGHDRGRTRLDRGTKRQQLDLPQTIRLVLDDRQLPMGIAARVPMSGKVLPAGRHAFRLENIDEDGAQTSRLRRVLRQRPITDDRVVGVGVHVEHRGVVQRDADAAQLARARARAKRSVSSGSP